MAMMNSDSICWKLISEIIQVEAVFLGRISGRQMKLEQHTETMSPYMKTLIGMVPMEAIQKHAMPLSVA